MIRPAQPKEFECWLTTKKCDVDADDHDEDEDVEEHDGDDDDNGDYDKQLIHLDAWGAVKVFHIGGSPWC